MTLLNGLGVFSDIAPPVYAVLWLRLAISSSTSRLQLLPVELTIGTFSQGTVGPFTIRPTHGRNVPIPDSCVAANHSSTPSARVSTRPEGPADLDHLGTLES